VAKGATAGEIGKVNGEGQKKGKSETKFLGKSRKTYTEKGVHIGKALGCGG